MEEKILQVREQSTTTTRRKEVQIFVFGLRFSTAATTSTTSSATKSSTTPWLSRWRATAWTTGRTIAALLLRLDCDAHLAHLPTHLNPHPTSTALRNRQTRDDGAPRRLDRGELDESTCLGAHNVDLLGRSEGVQLSTKVLLAERFRDTLRKVNRSTMRKKRKEIP